MNKRLLVAAISTATGLLVTLSSLAAKTSPDDPFVLAMGYHDAIVNSISSRLTSTDYTTYLHGKAVTEPGASFDPASHSRFTDLPMCGGDRSSWLALKCKALTTVDRQPHCGKKKNCHVFRVAPFVYSDEALRRAVTEAIEKPASFLYGPQNYVAAFGVGDLHAPGLALSPPAAIEVASILKRRPPGRFEEVETGIFVLSF